MILCSGAKFHSPKQNFRGACSRILLAIMGVRRNFRSGGQAQKNAPPPPHEVKVAKGDGCTDMGEKAPKNEKNVAKRPPI